MWPWRSRMSPRLAGASIGARLLPLGARRQIGVAERPGGRRDAPRSPPPTGAEHRTAAASLRFSVVRQTMAGWSATRNSVPSYRRATTDRGGAGVAITRSMTIASSGRGRDHVQPARRHPLDPRRRAQRLDLEPQVPVDRLFAGALLLHLLEPIAVAQQLEVLPRREQQHEHEEDADQRPSATSRDAARDRPRGRSGCCGRLS